MKVNKSILAVALILALSLVMDARSQEETADPSGPTTEDRFDRVWDYATLYESDTNSIFRKIVFTGRFQLDYARVDGEFRNAGELTDVDYSDTTVRRLRAGFKFDFVNNFVFHIEGEFDPAREEAYRRLTDTYVAWSSGDQFELAVGKQSIPFTLDGSTSSKRLLSLERNNLTNNIWFTVEYLPGVTGSGQIGGWEYITGVYSADSEAQEFGNFDQGTAFLASLAHDFSAGWGVDEAFFKLDFVYNEPRDDDSFNRSLENVLSLNFQYANNGFGLRGDASYARGYHTQSDIWGVVVMPFYDFSRYLQVVARYTRVESEDPGDVRYSRYENRAFDARGDKYNEYYVGLNWYIYGQKFKLQTGLKFVDMDDSTGEHGGDYNGIGWITGFRMNW